MAATPEHSFEVTWLPYFLDPALPLEGLDRVKYYEGKYGKDVKARWGRLMGRLNRHGVEVNLLDGFVLANSRTAHRLSHFVQQRHGLTAALKVQEAVFRYNHKEGRNIGDPLVLVRAAAEAGVEDPELEGYLRSDQGMELFNRMEDRLRERGVDGVPHFQFEGESACGALEPEEFRTIFRRLTASA
eukprot:EG_transcript_24887